MPPPLKKAAAGSTAEKEKKGFDPDKRFYINTYDENGKLICQTATTEEYAEEHGRRILEDQARINGFELAKPSELDPMGFCGDCKEEPCLMITRNTDFFEGTGDIMKKQGHSNNEIRFHLYRKTFEDIEGVNTTGKKRRRPELPMCCIREIKNHYP